MRTRLIVTLAAIAAGLPSSAVAAAHTVVVTQGPRDGATIGEDSVRFAFRAAGRVTCRLDREPTDRCAQSVTYDDLSDGGHTVTFQAGSARTVRRFTVHAVPAIVITAGPAQGSMVGTSHVRFTTRVVQGHGVSLRCRIGARPARACRSVAPFTLAPGRHTFTVTARNRYGSAVRERAFTVAVAPRIAFTRGPRPGAHLTTSHTSYTFAAAGATSVHCLLDEAPVSCRARKPIVLRHLAAGAHTLLVQAANRWGSDARGRSFTVIEPPRITRLAFNGEEPVQGARHSTLSSTTGILRVTWSSTGSAGTATCRLDGHTSACRRGDTLELEPGAHTFVLTLANAAGSDSRRVAIAVIL